MIAQEAARDVLKRRVQRRVRREERRRVLRPADEQGRHARCDGGRDGRRARDGAHRRRCDRQRVRGRVYALNIFGHARLRGGRHEEAVVRKARDERGAEHAAEQHAKAYGVGREVHVDEAREPARLDQVPRVPRGRLEVLTVDRHLRESPVVEECDQRLEVADETDDTAPHDRRDEAALRAVLPRALRHVVQQLHERDEQ
mmetsp:Transcript_20972/g.65201  ORF Transcript_20972/g.65201 Transcript_20972/m.65201 type:complete len:200 (-) Transcript_20972:809-1408(-)